ncbi:MAG: isocitrate lyase/phosphoenolpyruvate mutase family protein [Cyclobacteriaceae bacterium]|nr:isocitrate lyase/phosphoenolpyruvate mutase family protein [Cyclobacteriaceae bacterium HetDA_MAG_MS6]
MSKYTDFHSLHDEDSLLFLPNAWDVLSAMIIEQAGFRAIGTTSYGVANANGYNDGENISFDALLESCQKIVQAVSIPVTVDIEAGFGLDEDTVVSHVLKVADVGAVGINIEDSYKKSSGLKNVEEHAILLKALRKNLDDHGFKDFFINARIDTYLQQKGLQETIDRASRYVQSGANGVFIPGLSDKEEIRRVTHEIDAPLNVMSLPNLTSIDELNAIGVKRLSMGNAFSDAVIGFIEQTSTAVLQDNSTKHLYLDHTIKTHFKD